MKNYKSVDHPKIIKLETWFLQKFRASEQIMRARNFIQNNGSISCNIHAIFTPLRGRGWYGTHEAISIST